MVVLTKNGGGSADGVLLVVGGRRNTHGGEKDEKRGYLVLIRDAKKETMSSEQVPVVRVFPNDFLELFSLPLDREIEFIIDVDLGT